MIDHLTFTVRDAARSKAFYVQALAPLGYGVAMEFDESCGFGPDDKPCFWIKPGEPVTPPTHLAFVAQDRSAVDAFYAAALAVGATDNGAPGVREDYHPNYYAAFVLDPDGHNIEAVCHAAPGAKPREAVESSGPREVSRARRTPARKKAARVSAPKAQAETKKKPASPGRGLASRPTRSSRRGKRR